MFKISIDNLILLLNMSSIAFDVLYGILIVSA